MKRSFYAACNCISPRAKSLDELVDLSLQESYFLPILTYSSAATSFTVKQTHELHVCWSSAYRHIFHFNRWESVKCFINGLACLDLLHIRIVSCARYFHHILQCFCLVLYNLLWNFCRPTDNFSSDMCLNSLFSTKAAAVLSCYIHFDNICRPATTVYDCILFLYLYFLPLWCNKRVHYDVFLPPNNTQSQSAKAYKRRSV